MGQIVCHAGSQTFPGREKGIVKGMIVAALEPTVRLLPGDHTARPFGKGDRVPEAEVGAGGGVVENVVIVKVLDAPFGRSGGHPAQQIGGNVHQGGRRCIQGLSDHVVIGIPGQPLLAGDVIALPKRPRVAQRSDKGPSHVVAMAGHPKGRAVAGDDDRLALAQAVQKIGAPAKGVQDAAPLAIGPRRADHGHLEIASRVRLFQDALALGLAVGIGKRRRRFALRVLADRIAASRLGVHVHRAAEHVLRDPPTESADRALDVLRPEGDHVDRRVVWPRFGHLRLKLLVRRAVAQDPLDVSWNVRLALPPVVQRYVIATLHQIARDRRADQPCTPNDQDPHPTSHLPHSSNVKLSMLRYDARCSVWATFHA